MTVERDPVLEAFRSGDDEALMRALGEFSYRRAFRERDEDDADVDPTSFRGSILRLYDERTRVIAAIDDGIRAAPWWKRMWMRPVWRFAMWRATRAR